MIISYFRNASGEIYYVQKLPDDMPMEDAVAAVTNYNRNRTNAQAYLVEAEDDSLYAYLYQEARTMGFVRKEFVSATIGALETAISFMRDLED